MPEKFRNRYRITSARAPWWDYGKNGSYFITICTKNKMHFFGEIHDGILQKSIIGNIVLSIWEEIPDRFFYAKTGPFIVMPNHIHGIVTIDKPNPDCLDADADVETRLIASLRLRLRPNNQRSDPNNQRSDPNNQRSDPNNQHSNPNNQQIGAPSEKHRGGITGIHNPMLHQNLSRVLRWFTGRVTFESHKVEPLFNWQRRFHDHIVRNQIEYQRIERYILKNPLNWQKDRFY